MDIETVEQKEREKQSHSFSIEEGKLVVVGGAHQGQEILLERSHYHVGRDAWCDLVLDQDPWISSHHAEFHLSETGLRVRDPGSRNGLFLNGHRVFDALLRPGEQIRMGSCVLEYQTKKDSHRVKIPLTDEHFGLVGKSNKMQRSVSVLSRIANCDISTLLLGETGTGKTRTAQAIHKKSSRSKEPFVVVNCGALSASLIESSLFGHEKGAFTGANEQRKGVFEQAQHGTLLLDEVSELPLELQPKLLDVLERKQIKRLGGEREIPIDIRLITATHKDLRRSVEKKCSEKIYSIELPK